MGLLVDSSVIIALERRGDAPEELSAHDAGEPIALAAVTASELLVGVERADTPERRTRRRDFVEAILVAVPVFPVDLDVARVHARLTADLLMAGFIIGAHDLLIAARAISRGYGVLTINVRDFGRVPGLRVERAQV